MLRMRQLKPAFIQEEESYLTTCPDVIKCRAEIELHVNVHTYDINAFLHKIM